MISDETLRVARRTADDLRQQGELERAKAIEALVAAADGEVLPSLDLLTTSQAGQLLGVSAQTIKNWARQGSLTAYRVGGRIMVPHESVAEYVRRARQSLDLEELSDEEAARLVDEGRSGH